MIDLRPCTPSPAAVHERTNKTADMWEKYLYHDNLGPMAISPTGLGADSCPSLGNTNRASPHPLIRPLVHSPIRPFHSVAHPIHSTPFSAFRPSLGCYDDTTPQPPLPKPTPSIPNHLPHTRTRSQHLPPSPFLRCMYVNGCGYVCQGRLSGPASDESRSARHRTLLIELSRVCGGGELRKWTARFVRGLLSLRTNANCVFRYHTIPQELNLKIK